MKKPTIQKFEEVADKCYGNVTHIANAFKVSRKTVYEWINQDKEFSDAIEMGRDKIIDIAESAAITLIQGIPILDDKGMRVGWVTPPNPSSAHYVLSTLGRKRGYGERIDVTTKGESINRCNYAFGQEIKSPEDAKRILDEIKKFEENC